MNIITQKLNNNEFSGAGIFEIISVPMLEAEENTSVEYRQKFINILSEIYNSYLIFRSEKFNNEISAEFLWVTEPVSDQIFKAKIRFFMILRAVSAQEKDVISVIEKIAGSCRSALKLARYGISELENENDNDNKENENKVGNKEPEIFKNLNIARAAAIVRNESVENLNNSILPYCYCCELLNSYEKDLDSVVSSLIEHPNCALSIQVMPAMFDNSENEAIAKNAVMLDKLAFGVETRGVGNISFSGAKKLAETYKYYQENKNKPLFKFNFCVYGSEAGVESLLSKIMVFISGSSLHSVNIRADIIKNYKNFCALPWIINEQLSNPDIRPLWANINARREFWVFRHLPYIITAEEASGIFRLPFGTKNNSAGLPVNETDDAGRTYSAGIINAGDIILGSVKDEGGRSGNTIGVKLDDLAKHMLIVGTPGSGKTTFSVSVLDRLWKEHKIPFLVIEPAKNEYRAMIESIPELQVFTPGKNFISPFVFNPFMPPVNVRLETYKSTLKTAFAAAVSMAAPLDKIFEETINNCYADFRWLDNYTVNKNKGKIFNITDFIKCFSETFDAIGYTGDAKNIGRAGVVRLNSLVNLFDNYFSIPIQDLLEKPTVIELAAIENADQKALIISLLLLSILAYVNANYIGKGGLKNVILLEEAHVLLDTGMNVSSGQGEANPAVIAQGLIKRMLAEIRSYGVGIIIADQSPRKVSTDVVALTDIKVVFRLVEADDKRIAADSMNMDEKNIERMSRLRFREAFLFFNRLDRPVEILTPDYRRDNNIEITISDEKIRKLSTYWNDKRDKLRPYPECQHVKYCAESCDYERRLLAREIARRIFIKNFKAVGETDFNKVKKVFNEIITCVRKELNDEPYSKELLSCVKTHLWRKIRCSTKIEEINDSLIENSLKK